MELLSYEIYNNEKMFNIIKENEFENIQNYIPIYKKLFDISKSIINKINLKKKIHLGNIDLSNNNFIYNDKKIDFFIKYSPIINPIKYVVGEYEIENLYLPKQELLASNDPRLEGARDAGSAPGDAACHALRDGPGACAAASSADRVWPIRAADFTSESTSRRI